MNEEVQRFERRKQEHIGFALDPAHQSIGYSGLEQIHLFHEALPELDFQDVSLATTRLKDVCKTPFYVAGMTAGHSMGSQLNLVLAEICQARGWALGVGSQRRELIQKNEANPWEDFKRFDRLCVFANIGITQAIEVSPSELHRLVERLNAKVLFIHLNALQEALQDEGTPFFKGALKKLHTLVRELAIPIGIKETGCGFSKNTLERLADIGPSVIDVSGLGGTHWGRIEGARAQTQSLRAVASQTFARWGEPTVNSVLAAEKIFQKTDTEIWASGGVRTGLDAAKLIALGASQVGYAQPALQAALEGQESLDRWMQQQEFELKVALFCTGCATPQSLRQKENAWTTSNP